MIYDIVYEGDHKDGLTPVHKQHFEWNDELWEPGWYWVSIIYGENKRHEFITYFDENQTYSAPLDYDNENRNRASDLRDAYFLGPIPNPANTNLQR